LDINLEYSPHYAGNMQLKGFSLPRHHEYFCDCHSISPDAQSAPLLSRSVPDHSYRVAGSRADNCASIVLDFISRLIDAEHNTTLTP